MFSVKAKIRVAHQLKFWIARCFSLRRQTGGSQGKPDRTLDLRTHSSLKAFLSLAVCRASHLDGVDEELEQLLVSLLSSRHARHDAAHERAELARVEALQVRDAQPLRQVPLRCGARQKPITVRGKQSGHMISKKMETVRSLGLFFDSLGNTLHTHIHNTHTHTTHTHTHTHTHSLTHVYLSVLYGNAKLK